MESIQPLRNCPVCDCNNVQIIDTQAFTLPKGHPLEAGYNIVVCRACGFAYANIEAVQEDFDYYYREFSKYEDNSTSTGGGGSIEDSVRLEQTAKGISEFVNNKTARIVDIGCANGGLLACLEKLGFSNLVGVDPSPACVSYISSHLEIEAHVGSIFSLPKLGHFDLVVLSHVLEHIIHLKETVHILKEVLCEKGKIYAEVPDATRFHLFNYAPFQEFNSEHINYFSKQSLINSIENGGFLCKTSGSKTFETTPGFFCPAIFGLFEKQTFDKSGIIEKDVDLCGQLQVYIEESRKELTRIDSIINSTILRLSNSEIIVWGTGQLAMKLLSQTSLCKAKIAAFVDGNPINQGKTLLGYPIVSPEKIVSSGLPIVITSILHEAAIFDTIRKKLFMENEVIFLSNRKLRLS
jgi:SAM-dependent methyltransferase